MKALLEIMHRLTDQLSSFKVRVFIKTDRPDCMILWGVATVLTFVKGQRFLWSSSNCFSSNPVRAVISISQQQRRIENGKRHEISWILSTVELIQQNVHFRNLLYFAWQTLSLSDLQESGGVWGIVQVVQPLSLPYCNKQRLMWLLKSAF